MIDSQSSSGSKLVWVFFLLLFFAHQDFWLWSDDSLVLGFLPMGLAYHALFSVACSGLWAFACFRSWPEKLEQWADEDGVPGENPSST
jgi:hypothetical protein